MPSPILARQEGRLVLGRGPCPSLIMAIGEAPGYRESLRGLPFIGPAGDVLDSALFSADLSRDRLWLTNLIKYRIPGDGDPTEAEIQRDLPLLWDELDKVRPTYILTLGRASTQFFLGDVDMEQVHGIPHPPSPDTVGGEALSNRLTHCGRRKVLILPCYHPAAGLHSPELMALTFYDIQQAGLAIRGKLAPLAPDPYPDPDYRELTLPGQVSEALAGSPLVAIDTEGFPDRVWSCQFSAAPGTGYTLRSAPLIRHLFQSLPPGATVLFHNSLYDLEMLRAMGVDISHLPFRDTMVLAYLLRLEPQGLKPLAYRHAGMAMQEYMDLVGPYQDKITADYVEDIATRTWPTPDSQLLFEGTKARVYRPHRPDQWASRALNDLGTEDAPGPATLREILKRWRGCPTRPMVEAVVGPMRVADLSDVPLPQAVYYASRDPDATLRIYPRLQSMVASRGLSDVSLLDHSVIPMVESMQHSGMPADPRHFQDLSAWLQLEMDKVLLELRNLVGRDVNPNSPQQVIALMSKEDITKRTHKGKISTGRKALEPLRSSNPVMDKVVTYRELSKADDSFASVIPEKISPDGRIRCTLRVTRVSSGRIAASDPNLMAIPVRTDVGKRVRAGFKAPPGCLLGSWDLDQVEMRVMAHESQDPAMIALFHSGVDIHTDTAAKMFHVPVEEVDKTLHRYPAKRIGFGVITGITAEGLLDQMRMAGLTDWDLDLCQSMIDGWFRIYPGVKTYMMAKRQEARTHGYVRDFLGRIRHLPGISSPIPWVREEAERQSHSHAIQAGAQEIIKRAMAGLWEQVLVLQSMGYRVLPILQVHDELIFEFESGLEDLLDPMILTAMTDQRALGISLSVPLKAKGSWGPDWGGLKD